MGEAIKKSGVPGWAWSIILTVFLGLMSFTIGASAGNQKIKDDIEVNKTNIQKIEIEVETELEKKADAELQRRNYETLNRIEHKLDAHIAKDD